MTRIRYLTLLCLLLGGMASWAQDDFDPTDPSEPGQLTSKLQLVASPADGGSVSGDGNYVAGTKVTASASPSSGWVFIDWTDADGLVVSTDRSYSFTKGNTKEVLTAHFAFNPSGPGEPDELPHRLTLVAEEGGSVSGGGLYLSGKTVNIQASPYSYYDFAGWYRPDGTLYAAEASTTYIMGTDAATLTARFAFNPDSPTEPGEVNLWRLKLKAGEGGTVYADKYNLKTGESTNVRASANSGYVLTGWYENDEQVSSTASFTYTMGATGTTLEARFEFAPANPDEPAQIQQRKFSFTLKNVITKPGATVQFPILLTPRATLGDITLQLNFDPRLNVAIDEVAVAETTTPYTLQRDPVAEGDDAYDEGMTSYRFTLSGGSMVVGSDDTPTVTPILTFPVVIPADIETATAYKISINQISITNDDGSTQTAGTRNGRVTVYKLGDANGDDKVNVADYIGVANNILDKKQDVFIQEVSDVNSDDKVNVSDYIGVANIILYGNENGNASTREQESSTNGNVNEPE